MIFIFTALHNEARFFIKNYHLKRTNQYSPFSSFTNENIILTITGVGTLNCACAVSAILSNASSKNDKVYNIGIAGGNKEGLYLCNKITYEATGFDYYPDIVHHPFKEDYLVTHSNIWRGSTDGLHDMEGAGFYVAAKNYVSQENIVLLKIISDNGTELPNESYIATLFEKYGNEICNFINSNNISDKSTEIDIEIFAKKLKCTEAMKNELKRYAQYLNTTGKSIEDILPKHMLSCSTKKEGLKVLEYIRNKITAL